jgi:hypothetical protein
MLRLIYEGKTQGLDGDLRKLSKPNKWMHQTKHEARLAIAELFKLASVAVTKAYGQAS